MIKNYIFDFGQVIVRFDTNYMTGAYVKDPEKRGLIEKVAFDRLYWDPLDAGTITDQQIKQDFSRRLPRELCREACQVYDHWYENLPFVPGMWELLKEIRARGGSLYLLSNISIGFAENYSRVPQLRELFAMFDGLVFSGPIGMVKPEKRIFDHLLQTYSLRPEESIFIDDNPGNVEGARKAGLAAYLFDGDAEKLKKILNF